MKFGAPWCGPCRQIDRELTRLENSVDESRLRIVRVNVDQDPALARRYNVSSIPHLVLLQHGRKLDEHCGYLSEADLNKWIERSAVETNAFSPSTSLGEVHVNPFAQ